MNEEWWEGQTCYLCDYGWLLLIVIIIGSAAFFTRDLWLPELPDLCFTGVASQPLEEILTQGSGPTDVLFAFDQSGSMASMITGAKEDGLELMNSISRRRGTQRFGLVGFSDYVDFPYRLYEPLTEDLEAVQAAITALELADGGDIPESYGRVMFESYNDETVGWAEEAQKYLVVFGDSYPHDPDVGPDELMGTADDLVLAEVLQEMAANNITLVFVAPPSIIGDATLLDWWEGWAEQTGGSIVQCETVLDSTSS